MWVLQGQTGRVRGLNAQILNLVTKSLNDVEKHLLRETIAFHSLSSGNACDGKNLCQRRFPMEASL